MKALIAEILALAFWREFPVFFRSSYLQLAKGCYQSSFLMPIYSKWNIVSPLRSP